MPSAPKRCEVCDSPLEMAIAGATDPSSGEHFDVLRCGACGLGQTSPIPSDIGNYYGHGYYGGRHSFTAAHCASRRVGVVERATAFLRGSLLDIGCGDGAFLVAAAKRGHRVVGTEVGEAAIRARSAGIDVRPSLDELRDAAPFDVVTMWHTLEHFTSPKAVVAGVVELLSPGGVFVVAVPNAQGLQARVFGRHWFHLDVPRHLYHFGVTSLSKLLIQSGFAIERFYHKELEYDMFGWIQSGLNAMTGRPNALFRAMTGKSGRADEREPLLTLHFAAASILAPAAAAATVAGASFGRGGTLVAVARSSAPPARESALRSSPETIGKIAG